MIAEMGFLLFTELLDRNVRSKVHVRSPVAEWLVYRSSTPQVRGSNPGLGKFPDNGLSVAFSQRSSSPRLIADETFNDSDIINNLINYEDEQEEPDSLRVDRNMQGSSFPTN
ncbi:hypothetical protein TNCV_2014841 [Trichonephila clavipes]|nr:hypothetical protein TNCV_2014841 [Trichonephila clavipes]